MSRTDFAERDMRVSPEAVYRAFVDAAAFARWLPPGDMRGEFEWFDPRPGGGFRMTLRYADPDAGRGKSSADGDTVETRFVALVPGERVVWTSEFVSDDPAFAGMMTMTWRFDSVPKGTRVSVTCTDVPRGIVKADHDAGLASSLANLAAYVEAAPA